MKLNKFIKDNYNDMFQAMTEIVNDRKLMITSDPEGYTDFGCDAPSVDVRLCIDIDMRDDHATWIIRTGSANYDQQHSQYCGALSIGLDTDPKELLNNLINQLD